MLKKMLLSSLCLPILIACGGGSDNLSPESSTSTPTGNTNTDNSSQSGNTTPNALVYRVIDGYLAHVDVCVIRTAGAQCEPLGTTDEQGAIQLPADTKGQLVARVVAGQAKDMDSAGYVPFSFEMTAEINANSNPVITPFTTLDVLDKSKTIADIATELNLPLALISGDYVNSEASEQKSVHALARAITKQLQSTLNDNDVLQLNSQAQDLNNFIRNTLLNDGTDLDDIDLDFDDGTIVRRNRVTSLKSFLEQGPLNIVSMETNAFSREGIRQVTFDGNQVSLNGFSSDYRIDGDYLVSTDNGTEVRDRFIYVSEALSLSYPLSQGDLTIITPHYIGRGNSIFRESKSWQKSDFVGHTHYLIFDDAPGYEANSDPTMVKMTFSDDTVLLEEPDQVQTVTWKFINNEWESNTYLELYLGERILTLSEVFHDKHVSVVSKSGPPQILVSDPHLANDIYSQWRAPN